jgi:hypothetical protein
LQTLPRPPQRPAQAPPLNCPTRGRRRRTARRDDAMSETPRYAPTCPCTQLYGVLLRGFQIRRWKFQGVFISRFNKDLYF